jgi:F-type H+-transporting ATPase subunit delta
MAKGSPVAPEAAVAELNRFGAALAASPELRTALMTPAVPTGRKRAVIGRIAAVLEISQTTRNFLYVLIDHRRITALAEMVQAFELAVDQRLGFARAEVSSAREIDGPRREALNRELEKLTGKRVRMRFAVNESLIGGVIAQIGSTVYDGSVRGRLHAIGRRLSAES